MARPIVEGGARSITSGRKPCFGGLVFGPSRRHSINDFAGRIIATFPDATGPMKRRGYALGITNTPNERT